MMPNLKIFVMAKKLDVLTRNHPLCMCRSLLMVWVRWGVGVGIFPFPWWSGVTSSGCRSLGSFEAVGQESLGHSFGVGHFM